MIMIWSGSVGSIPTGWVLCNGSNSTPDLRDKFVIGAGTSYAVGGTGGSKDAVVVSHTHTATDSGHTHTIAVANQSNVNDSTSGGDQRPQTSSTTLTTATGTANITVASTGVSGNNANLPPYYALCYIMKT
jgi:microcystin-dependent protein